MAFSLSLHLLPAAIPVLAACGRCLTIQISKSVAHCAFCRAVGEYHLFGGRFLVNPQSHPPHQTPGTSVSCANSFCRIRLCIGALFFWPRPNWRYYQPGMELEALDLLQLTDAGLHFHALVAKLSVSHCMAGKSSVSPFKAKETAIGISMHW